MQLVCHPKILFPLDDEAPTQITTLEHPPDTSPITVGTTFGIVQGQGTPHARMVSGKQRYPDSPESKRLQQFIYTFTNKRIQLGYTQ